VYIAPKTLDPVGVRAVRREEVEHYAPVEILKDTASEFAVVDLIVVDDEMNSSTAWVECCELPEKRAEELAGLAAVADPNDVSGASVECAGEVVLLVLAWGDDDALRAGQHPVSADLGIQMNVHLIGEIDGLALGAARGPPSDRGQNLFATPTWPGTTDNGLG
jgi:hypothetical protein